MDIFYFAQNGRLSDCIKYFKTLIAAGFISLLIWPVSLYHILFGYRGTEAVEKLAARGFLQNAGEYSQVVARSFLVAAGRVCGLCCLFFLYWELLPFGSQERWKKKSETERKNTKKWMFVIVPALFYSLFMIQITPVREDRYLMCVFPFWAMVLAWGIKTLSKVSRVKALRNGSFLILSMVLILVNIFTTPNYLWLYPKRWTRNWMSVRR